ncbi:MAG: thioredoxin [Candidatus Marinimicrobia bacterium]|nr:thioredoxin [Candidatus Neomarinimicrobiota bacterium]MCH7939788.1 thioredoxin [Candidatus Neomarinimicrobiota bacterium]
MGAEMIELSAENFDQQVVSSDRPVLVDFWAEWCGPCKAIEPALKEVAADYEDRVVVGRLNVDEHPTIASRYGIRSIPSILLFQNGEVSDQIVGAVPKSSITNLLDNLIQV